MIKKFFNKITKIEQGAVSIIEATIVFPIMFTILFVLIYMGNIYYIRANMEALAEQYAIKGADYCVDPNLKAIRNGEIPSIKNIKTEPYRYIFGGMNGVEKEINDDIRKIINNGSLSLFKGMKPEITNNNVAKFNNYILYSTFSVQIDYKFTFPIKLPGANDFSIVKGSVRADVAVNDTAEFIRNVDMAIDLFGDTKAAKEIEKVFGKIKEVLDKFAGK